MFEVLLLLNSAWHGHVKKSEQALNSVTYKMMKTVSDHINERKLAMQLVLNFIEI